MQKKMVSTEFSAVFKQLSLLRTSIGDLILLWLFECQSPSAEVTEQCVEYSQYLQQNIPVNEWSKPAYLNDAAFKTCLESNILLNYTTLTVHKL